MNDPIEEELHEISKNKKSFGYLMITAAIVFIVSIIALGFNGGIIGYAIYDTFESNHSVSGSSEDNSVGFVSLPNFKMSVGDKFKYQVDGWGEGTFRDDTTLFDISTDGLIEFTPSEEDVGIYNVWVIIKNKESYHYQNVIFVIEE